MSLSDSFSDFFNQMQAENAGRAPLGAVATPEPEAVPAAVTTLAPQPIALPVPGRWIAAGFGQRCENWDSCRTYIQRDDPLLWVKEEGQQGRGYCHGCGQSYVPITAPAARRVVPDVVAGLTERVSQLETTVAEITALLASLVQSARSPR